LSIKTLKDSTKLLEGKAKELLDAGKLSSNAYLKILEKIGDAEKRIADANPFVALFQQLKSGAVDFEELGDAASKSLNIVSGAMSGLGRIASTLGADSSVVNTLNAFSEMFSGAANLASGLSTDNIQDSMNGIMQLTNAVATLFVEDQRKQDERRQRKILELQAYLDRLSEAYDRLSVKINKSYSKKASELYEEQIKSIDEQKKIIEQQKVLEDEKKETDTAAINEFDKKINELTIVQEQLKEKAQDAIFGADVQSAIDDFA
ncbi:MAG: hypothetical protein RR410_09270, partial [Alistipes sp.]